MKTILFGRSNQFFDYVFSESVISYLKENTDWDGNVYTPNDFNKNAELFKDTEYIISTWLMPYMSEEEIKKYFPSLKCIFYAAGSVQYFARPFMANNVRIFSAWAANAIPVAEYTVSQIILANKGFFATQRPKNRQAWEEGDALFRKYTGNYMAKVGIIGAGMIGNLVIRKLKDYDLEVVVCDPFLKGEKALELGVKKVSLEEIFETCNTVSNHVASNESTKGMFTKELFLKMPKYATFINTGRGAQVVENDLIQVLKERPDLTAILDVTEELPPPENSPLFSISNCIITPHIAGSSGNEVHRLAEYILEEYKSVMKTGKGQYEVTLKMLETMA